MRFLVIGSLGSVGRRRINCLRRLGHEFEGWDIKDGTPQPDVTKFDGLFISTPPDQHFEHICAGQRANKPAFVEASVIKENIPSHNTYPSCTLRFHPIVNQIRDQVRNTKPLAFTYHVGNNIQDWHPTEDYRTKYFARKDTGGCREIVAFENEWLSWVFGKAKVISGYHGKLSDLEMEADDYYSYTLEFESGVIGNIVIDVLSRPQCREFKLIYAGTTKYYDLQHIDWEPVYLEETKAFIEAIQGRQKWEYSVEDDLANLDMLAVIENHKSRDERYTPKITYGQRGEEDREERRWEVGERD